MNVISRSRGDAPLWSQALCTPAAFDHEQTKLGRYWTLLGLTTDLPNDGDWFRTSLGGRSVFVQRFGEDLRGFENVCAHRFYPLRTGERGNGPIRCGFHHWQYNEDGLAVGVPQCGEMFRVSPRDLNARLRPLDIATCGILIFGRFAPDDGESLQDYLGPGFPILQAMWSATREPWADRFDIAANWRFGYHISLDDYHLVAVHPSTFGRSGYLAPDTVQYYRFGRHSAYFHGADSTALTTMADACAKGVYSPPDYRIFQFFPNLIAVHFEAARHWFVLIQQYQPVAFDRTLLRSWFAPAPFPPPKIDGGLSRLAHRVAGLALPYVIPFYMRRINGEDIAICERNQTTAAQIERPPRLGRHEERIAWFEEAYAQAVHGVDDRQ